MIDNLVEQLKVLRINILLKDLNESNIYNEIFKKYILLLYKKYSALREEEKRILYTYKLIEDGSTIKVAIDCAATNTIDYIESQLKEVFDYKDDTYI